MESDCATAARERQPLHRYWCAGFDVSSSRPLPAAAGETRSSDAPRVEIEWTDTPVADPGPLVFAWPGRFGLRLHRDAAARNAAWTWTTGSGASVTHRREDGVERLACATPDAAGVEIAAGVLVRRILPRLAAHRGRLVMHAAACAAGDRAVLITGPSGAGKSTLATALTGAGAALLADDLATLTTGDDGVACAQTAMGACLWPDALAGVGQTASGPLVAGHDDKRWCPLPAATMGATLVRQVWIVSRESGEGPAASPVSVEPLAREEAMARLWPLVVPFYPGDVDSQRSSWTALAALVDSADVAVLRYPSGFERLPLVARALAI